MSSPPAKCGTDGGYYRHRKTTKTEPCTPCREAHAEAQRLGKQRRRAGDRYGKCPCGTDLRTEHDRCSRCRKRMAREARQQRPNYDEADTPSPVQWVRRGLIWHQVDEQQSEVA